MTIEQAPFQQLPGTGQAPATAFWVRADDGIKLRLAVWRCEGITPLGSVLLFPGRTEFVEKYAPFARELTAAGYEVLAIDWRGQGLSDRLQENPRPGHIGEFADYQRDVIEMVVAASRIDLPKPWHLLAHSMGGCIGLAALLDDLPVASAVFSAPMWGIDLHGLPTPLALLIASVAGKIGFGGHSTPGSGGNGTYMLDTAFTGNLLTYDPNEWTRGVKEAAAWPEMTIGGASYDWLSKALRECARLTQEPSPDVPAIITVGGDEKIVLAKAIRDRAGRWDGAQLLEYDSCRHEIMMEGPVLRAQFLHAALRQFSLATMQPGAHPGAVAQTE